VPLVIAPRGEDESGPGADHVTRAGIGQQVVCVRV
jgi:hypothetical protein